MDRLHHLEQTLPINLLATASYPNREFVLVDYGSTDNLHLWVKNNLKKYIDSGIVKYCRTQKPKYFIATHAKNIAHKQASGDIFCNVDADNFLLEGFAEHIACILKQGNCIISSPPTDMFNVAGSCGKIALLREHFYKINGYDESLNLGWGWDDTSLQFRARMYNHLENIAVDKKWCLSLYHSNHERGRKFRNTDIEFTKDQSIRKIVENYEQENYIANKNKNWGFIEDLSINIL